MENKKQNDTNNSTHTQTNSTGQHFETFILLSIITYIFSTFRDYLPIFTNHSTPYFIVWVLSYPTILRTYYKYR